MVKKKTTSKSQASVDPELLRIAIFILFDALIFHESIAAARPEISPLLKLRQPLKTSLVNEWNKILRIDYREVFEIAKEILNDFPASPETEEILRRLVLSATDIMSSGILRKHDFLGRIYHKLLLGSTGPYYATYYTSIPAAWLLSQIAIRAPNQDWDFSSLESIEDFRVLDPACGSGTLLSASYMALKDAYIMASAKKIDLNRFHKICIERTMQGWDVLDYAAHLTLTTLALHNHAEFDHSKVWVLPTGVDDNNIVHLGSLDHLSDQIELVGKGLDFFDMALKTGLEVRKPSRVDTSKKDLVIMNPPFSRSAKPNVKFGYTSKDVKKRMIDALKKLAKARGLEGIGQAGLGAYFIFLADSLLKKGGRMAFVLPRAMLSGVSWKKARTLLTQHYHLEYVISNYDPGNPAQNIDPWNWSENTDLGEVLVVARKLSEPETIADAVERDTLTHFVGFARKPANEVESLLAVQDILKKTQNATADSFAAIRVASQDVGHIYSIPQARLEESWLFPCLFANPTLNQLSSKLFDRLRAAPRLSALHSSSGTDIKQIKDNFAQSTSPTNHRIVWGQQAAMNTLLLAPEHVGYGTAKRASASELLIRSKQSTLLVSERPHLSNDCLVAAECVKPALATAYWEIQLRDEKLKPHGAQLKRR